MICVDTSALVAILCEEPSGPACAAALQGADETLISAGTVAEAMIVAGGRRLGQQMRSLIEVAELTVVAVDHRFAMLAAEAYDHWGRGHHAAQLNYGDCFAYALAARQGCPLLYIGEDFSKTDIKSAL